MKRESWIVSIKEKGMDIFKEISIRKSDFKPPQVL